MASPVISTAKCAMPFCPHAGQPLSDVVRPAGCVFDCTAPICGGCVRDIVKATGEFKCPTCRQVSSSFSGVQHFSAMDMLRENHQEARKQLKRARGAGAAAEGAEEGGEEEKEWGVDAIIGVQMFGGTIYYKVAWTELLNKKHFAWINVESSCTWEEKENLSENCAHLLAAFRDKWMIPNQLADGFHFEFLAPMVRVDQATKKRVYGCAHPLCEKKFGTKDAAVKHATSEEHWKANNNTNKSPFPCSLCCEPDHDTSVNFWQKSARDRHCKQFHVVTFAKEDWDKWGLELDGEEWELAKEELEKKKAEEMDVDGEKRE